MPDDTLSSDQLAAVAYLSGVNPNGTLAGQSFWTWHDDNPATYDQNASSAHKWTNDAAGNTLARPGNGSSPAGTPGGTVTFAFDPSDSWTAAQQQAFVTALTVWSDEVNIRFQEVSDPSSADVLLSVGGGNVGSSARSAPASVGTVGQPGVPDQLTPSSSGGRQAGVFYNTAYGDLGSFSDKAGYSYATLIHETGHLLGLGHSGPYDDGNGQAGSEQASSLQMNRYDSQQWSAMSYIRPDDTTAKYRASYTVAGTNWVSTTTTTLPNGTTRTTFTPVAPETPMPLDILAAQRLYGLPTSTALSGGQVFGFNCNITDASEALFDFSKNVNPVVTLWDAGTGNTLDLSGYSMACTVNLSPGTFSSVGNLTNNVGIAFGTRIDAAIGGSGNDVFRVNADGDSIDGRGGSNTVVFSGNRSQYTIADNGAVVRVTNGQAGTVDTLTNIQYLQFADQTIPTEGAHLTSADPLFDVAYYLANNPDVAASGTDPYQHYATYGWHEGRNPSALFNTTFYLNQNPDVRAAGMNPLTHYGQYGWQQGRDPSASFSTSAYLAANPDVKAAGVDPLQHYQQYGRAEGRPVPAATPHATGPQDPLVSATTIYAERPDVAAAGMDATAWFNSYGWRQGANPDPQFDTNFYLTQNPDVKASGMNPLLHYEQYGWKEGRSPSLVFSGSKYLAANPDVARAGLNPLLHYAQYGQREGRMSFLSGPTGTVDPLVNAAFYDAQLGATLIPTGTAAQAQAQGSYDATGWLKGLDPDPWFDTSYYLTRYPDVAKAGIDPLLHYERYGWKEGRDPSAAFSTGKYLAANPDVRAAGLDPLVHYVQYGQAEGRAIFAA